MTHWIGVLALGLCLPFAMTAALADDTQVAPAAPDAIAGYWESDGGGAVIQSEADRHTGGWQFPGRIVWLEEDHYPADDDQGMGGQPVVDRHNPDTDKRDRPMIGLQMIRNLDYHVTDTDHAEWQDGQVYDSDRGRWFDCYVWLADANHLKLHGYIGIRALGRTTTWTRVADPSESPPPRRHANH